MFRYLALAWDDTNAAVSSLARRLGLEVQGNADWRVASSEVGLQVFVTGTKDRVNTIYPLRATSGVIVGKLFRTREVGGHAASDVVLSESEAHRIQQSGGRELIDEFWVTA